MDKGTLKSAFVSEGSDLEDTIINGEIVGVTGDKHDDNIRIWFVEAETMTNPDQDVTLDGMAKYVVEWMDGWECREINNWGSVKFTTDVGEDYHLNSLYKSLDVIREVEEALDDANKYYIYMDFRLAGRDVNESVISGERHLDLQGAEERLRAIYVTLRESGEI